MPWLTASLTGSQIGYGGTVAELANEKLNSVETAGKVSAEEMFCKLDGEIGNELHRDN